MPEFFYVGLNGRPLEDVARAVSVHLNYLEAGKTLTNVTAIHIEGADHYTVPPHLYHEVISLREIDSAAATSFRRTLLRQRILDLVLSPIYRRTKDIIRVVAGIDLHKPQDASVFDIGTISASINPWLRIIESTYGADYYLEKQVKDGFDQVAAPRLDSLAIDQAKLAANLKHGIENAEAKRSEMQTSFEKKLADSEARLIGAIRESKAP